MEPSSKAGRFVRSIILMNHASAHLAYADVSLARSASPVALDAPMSAIVPQKRRGRCRAAPRVAWNAIYAECAATLSLMNVAPLRRALTLAGWRNSSTVTRPSDAGWYQALNSLSAAR